MAMTIELAGFELRARTFAERAEGDWLLWTPCTQQQAAHFGQLPGYDVRALYTAAPDPTVDLPGLPPGFRVAQHGRHGFTVGSPAGDVVTAAPRGPHHSRVLHALLAALLAAPSIRHRDTA